MAKGKSEVKRNYWRAVFERHARGGLSIAKFCRTEGISESSFYWWKRILSSSTTKARKAESVPRTQTTSSRRLGTNSESHDAR
ncbi:MAG TPA: hypothetical protein DD670_07390 [Planctomycetaceae bacterium]|nr:hypothetical protein [Planctomycetaceae bacterium]